MPTIDCSTRHWIVIDEVDDEGVIVAMHVECSDPAACEGWSECDKDHSDGGYHDNRIGPYECDERVPWFDIDVWTFHGVEHTYEWGHGWTVPCEGCPIQTYGDLEWPGPSSGNKVGRYEVDDDWDDVTVYLTLMEE